jgi:hypothetical protein
MRRTKKEMNQVQWIDLQKIQGDKPCMQKVNPTTQILKACCDTLNTAEAATEK